MDEYFATPMGMGRYGTQSKEAVFSADRQYFDKLLHGNASFRQEYASAYAAWLAGRRAGARASGGEETLGWRIEEGIRRTGEETVQRLFEKVLDIANAAAASPAIPKNVALSETLPGGRIAESPEYAAQMHYLKKFWLRLAIPAIRGDV